MTSNGTIDFSKSVKLRTINEFSSKADVSAVLAFIREQKVPGELVVSLPGNGGITAIVFREKEKSREVEVPEM